MRRGESLTSSKPPLIYMMCGCTENTLRELSLLCVRTCVQLCTCTSTSIQMYVYLCTCTCVGVPVYVYKCASILLPFPLALHFACSAPACRAFSASINFTYDPNRMVPRLQVYLSGADVASQVHHVGSLPHLACNSQSLGSRESPPFRPNRGKAWSTVNCGR